ncbi:hypothetical protein D3C71_2002580 [compost metagenome]
MEVDPSNGLLSGPEREQLAGAVEDAHELIGQLPNNLGVTLAVEVKRVEAVVIVWTVISVIRPTPDPEVVR